MGYMTRYEVSVKASEDAIEQIDQKIRSWDSLYDVEEFMYDGLNFWSFEAKWWEDEKHMGILSIEFPDLMFMVEGQGDDSDDLWREYYKNGKHLLCRSHRVFEPFVEANMQPVFGEGKYEE